MGPSNEDFKKAYELRRDNAIPLYNLGLNSLLTEDFEEALENFNSAIEIDKDEPTYYSQKGVALYFMRSYEDSLSSFLETHKIYDKIGGNEGFKV